jgi:hypothetical protein
MTVLGRTATVSQYDIPGQHRLLLNSISITDYGYQTTTSQHPGQNGGVTRA